MKPEKSIIISIISVCCLTLFGWFLIIAPWSKTQDLIKKLPSLVNTNLVENFPADLKINVKKGIVSINKISPYCLTLPYDKTKVGNVGDGVVFDVYAKADISSLGAGGMYSKLCKPFALVGKDFLLYPGEDNTYKYTKLSDTMNFDVDREIISKYVNQYMPVLISFANKAYFILPFAFLPLILVFIFLMNCWYAIVVKLAAKIFKIRTMSFGESYKLSLFFYNFLLIFNLIVIKYILRTLLKQDFSLSFPFINTIVITAASMFYLKNRPVKPEQEFSQELPTDKILAEAKPVEMTKNQPKSTSIPTGQ